MLAGLWLHLSSAHALTTDAVNGPAVAFFYGANPPWSELQAFDLVVVDPDHVPDPSSAGLTQTRLAAYVALGEVHPTRNYAAAIPSAWLVGDNKDWGSRLIDQSHPQWPVFFAERVVAPLWGQGYRTLFLDTLDSYHLFAKTADSKAQQEAGMVAVIQLVRQRFPGIKLIFNRGFEILGRTHQQVEMVVAESLFQGFDAGKNSYKTVPAADREWLLAQFKRIREDYKLPVLVIDYVPASNRELARTTALRITDLGLIPWVATPDLGTLGVGSIEVMPRKVLVVHSPGKDEFALRQMEPIRRGAMPLNFLGYVPDYVDTQHLPQAGLVGRYAGVVVWLTTDLTASDRASLNDWLTNQSSAGLPLALVNPPMHILNSPLALSLGIRLKAGTGMAGLVEVIQQNAMMGFETPPVSASTDFLSVSITQGEPLLTLKRGADRQVGAALMPWGGFVMDPFVVRTLAGNSGDRWVINPFEFFRQALRLPAMPVPDVTTESGRRLLMVHMDGDGFISRSELPGFPMAGQVVLDRVVNTYPVPMTISVIEAELSAKGLYPGLSNAAEKVAREIFKAPHVAMASHSYSHPFVWRKAIAGDESGSYHLRLPGYSFDLQREIEGSIRYIQSQLAPPGKKVEMFLWTGDCIPGSAALALTTRLGILNMNGGDTVATRSQPTVTMVEGLGIPRPGGFQVFAPNQNENVYTNNWLGPFYGFERVTETFEFTEKPRRLKPINIYFHTYLTTKAAGMKSLDKVFAYALAQETTPIHISAYARNVLDFQSLAIARTATGWRVRGAKNLRNLRMTTSLGWPDLAKSQAVAGFTNAADEVYIHLAADSADLALSAVKPEAVRLVSANARIEGFERLAKGFRWQLSGHVPLKFVLANAQNCQVRVEGRELAAVRREAELTYFEIKNHAARPLEAICRS
jgi:uncharacterized protein (TIGR01370 family)